MWKLGKKLIQTDEKADFLAVEYLVNCLGVKVEKGNLFNNSKHCF